MGVGAGLGVGVWVWVGVCVRGWSVEVGCPCLAVPHVCRCAVCVPLYQLTSLRQIIQTKPSFPGLSRTRAHTQGQEYSKYTYRVFLVSVALLQCCQLQVKHDSTVVTRTAAKCLDKVSAFLYKSLGTRLS